MNFILPFLLLLMLASAGCSGQKPAKPQPQPVKQVPAKTRAETRIDLPGHYSASRVSGDYVGYRELDEFIARMEASHGIPRSYLNGLFCQARRKDWTLNYMNRQGPSTPPKPGAWTRYRAQFLTGLHIDGGAAFWRRHEQALQQASRQYGVPPEYIVGIMGVETVYGRNMGKDRVFDALTTLAFDYPRRGQYFSEELENYLVMSMEEGVDPLELRGSFAGAMGLGQFMPGSFLKWAVDFNGDGRRDLWDPDDAIGSIANYFAQHGWRPGEPVVTPAEAAGPVDLEAGYDKFYSLSDLASRGIQPAAPVSGDEQLSLLLLRGADSDEYWLGHQNFFVITRYNHSTHYAMAVHQLAQAVKQRYLGSLTTAAN